MVNKMTRQRATKKDRLYGLILAIVLGNLGYLLAGALTSLWYNPQLLQLWALVFANIIAIVGLLWLMRDYIRKRKREREAEESQNIKEIKHTS